MMIGWLVKANMKTKEDFYEMREKLNKIHFNNQVRATPYLLVYTKRDKLLTESKNNLHITNLEN